MRARPTAALRIRAGLPFVAGAVVLAGALGGCASDGSGGVDVLGDGGEGAASWPASVPRPDLPLVEETDLLIAFSATYELGGSSPDAYVGVLESEGFAPAGQDTWSDGEHVVLLEVERRRLYVTITDA